MAIVPVHFLGMSGQVLLVVVKLELLQPMVDLFNVNVVDRFHIILVVFQWRGRPVVEVEIGVSYSYPTNHRWRIHV